MPGINYQLKAAGTQRSERFMQMNPDKLPNLILPAHTCSSFLLPGGLMSRRGVNSGVTPALLTSRAGKCFLSLCHFCTCSTNTFIFDFPAGCLPTPAHTVVFEVSPAPGWWQHCRAAGRSSQGTKLPQTLPKTLTAPRMLLKCLLPTTERSRGAWKGNGSCCGVWHCPGSAHSPVKWHWGHSSCEPGRAGFHHLRGPLQPQ